MSLSATSTRIPGVRISRPASLRGDRRHYRQASSGGYEGPYPPDARRQRLARPRGRRFKREGIRNTRAARVVVFRRGDVGYGGESPEDFWGALRGVWLDPVRFFRALDPRGGAIRPAIFAFVVLYLNLLFEAALQMLWLREFNYAMIYAPFLGLVVAIVLAPLLVAGLAIVVLFILGGGKLSHGGFGPLFRSLGYASGIGLALWIPLA